MSSPARQNFSPREERAQIRQQIRQQLEFEFELDVEVEFELEFELTLGWGRLGKWTLLLMELVVEEAEARGLSAKVQRCLCWRRSSHGAGCGGGSGNNAKVNGVAAMPPITAGCSVRLSKLGNPLR